MKFLFKLVFAFAFIIWVLGCAKKTNISNLWVKMIKIQR